VAALFAIMTKVGVYSIIRVTTLVFGEDAGAAAWAPASWMLPAALLTVGIGFVGLLAANRLRELAAFAIVGSTGTLLVAVALFEQPALAAAIYYLPHSTLAGALLFLAADLIARRRADLDDRLQPGPRHAGIEPLSLIFLLAAVALAGLPPLSGFVGKLLVLDAARDHAAATWIWATILGTTFLAIIAFARAGSLLFWKSAEVETLPRTRPPDLRPLALLPASGLLALLALLTLFAGPATDYAGEAAAQIFSPLLYIETVLGGHPGGVR
jgi:multicomponent K+:H+ antiporter subunit D